MFRRTTTLAFCFLIPGLMALASACAPAASSRPAPAKKTIAATYSILGAVVQDLVGDSANVITITPNGQDPHEWEPSAQDIGTLNRANLIVQNGLGLEGGMGKALARARQSGVRLFTASDHIVIRKVGPGEGRPTGDPDQSVGADDPHLWMDPLSMKMVVDALAVQLKSDLGIDVGSRAHDVDSRLDALNKEISDQIATIPSANRKLVTGHESMGYFAERYGFKLVGAIIPNLGTQAEVSAADLAELKKQIQDNQVKAIFTELGTSPAVAAAIGKETGVQVIQLTTHGLPPDGSYATFMRNAATVIVNALR